MEFLINLFWALISIAAQIGGSALLIGLIATAFYLFSILICDKILKLKSDKEYDYEDGISHACIYCAIFVFLIVAIFSNYFGDIIAEIKSIFT